MMRNAAKRIVVGRIAGVFGVKGWLKVMSYTSPRENILNYTPWQIQLKDTWREVCVQDWKAHNKGLTVVLEGIDDRDVARELTGADILVLRSQLEELPQGEYYQEDLLEMEVINREGKSLGRVKEIMETGANEVLVIEGEHRHLVPLVWDRYLLAIDQDTGVIRVDWEELD
jgi:16S rRNA processing protein RimM